jgi:hypothetical protein
MRNGKNNGKSKNNGNASSSAIAERVRAWLMDGSELHLATWLEAIDGNGEPEMFWAAAVRSEDGSRLLATAEGPDLAAVLRAIGQQLATDN